MKRTDADALMDRRQLLALGATFGATALFSRILAACGDGSAAAGVDAGDAATTTSDAGDILTADAADIPWATGGTASMTGKASYPDPFTELPTTCAASCQLTQGPCYSSQSVVIQDISYGYTGLPMRCYLRLLDENCKPVSGATVDLWHVGPTGIYSGDDAKNEDVAFCTDNEPAFTSALYFRGKQTTDANGEVYFDSCFPGWYSSRTIHIHMTISVGTTAYLTTQFGFDDALDNDIIATQPIYKDRGSRDTTNATDTVLPTDPTDYVFATQKMPDGAMLAWKTIMLRNALSETLCSPAGANSSGGGMGGDGGMGGPGGDGGMMPPGDGGMPPGM